MPKSVYDTRFFIEHLLQQRTLTVKEDKEAIRKVKERFVSAIVLHEIYWLTLEQEGQDTATMRSSLIEKDFKIVKVDAEIAKSSAYLRRKYHMGMAESIIAATAQVLKATCLSDDPNFKSVTEIRTTDLT